MPRLKKTSSLSTQSDLSQRQLNLLFSVIKEYCETGQTVGSKEIRDKYGFNFSSATIRNEFAALRELGFLFQPFTNASSKPTEKAFKLFVNQLIAGLQVTNRQQLELKQKIFELENQQNNLNKEISRLLALNGNGVGFAVDHNGESLSGIQNLLDSPTEGKVSDILNFLDNLDSYKKPLLEGKIGDENGIISLEDLDSKTTKKISKKRLKTTFGTENPTLPLGKGYALVATEVIVKGNKSVVGIIAPTHLLARKKNLELMDGLSKVLGGEG